MRLRGGAPPIALSQSRWKKQRQERNQTWRELTHWLTSAKLRNLQCNTWVIIPTECRELRGRTVSIYRGDVEFRAVSCTALAPDFVQGPRKLVPRAAFLDSVYREARSTTPPNPPGSTILWWCERNHGTIYDVITRAGRSISTLKDSRSVYKTKRSR